MDALATLCINLSRVADIEAVVIGGGFALAGESLRLQIEKSIRKLTWNVLPTDFRVVLSSSPAHVGILGAAISVTCVKPNQSIDPPSQPQTSLLHAEDTSNNSETIRLESKVEQVFLHDSGLSMRYAPVEKVTSIQVENVYELGKLVSLRFLEWALDHPEGVIALPTGRTPEYFIKTMERLKETWREQQTQAELLKYGFPETSLAEFPMLSGLTFVMLDEFFPMSPKHRNSFCNYIELFYTSMMDINPQKVLKFDLVAAGVLTEAEINMFSDIDVDLSLLSRDVDEVQLSAERKVQRGVLLKVEQYCQQFEARVRALGGIGFFLGGTVLIACLIVCVLFLFCLILSHFISLTLLLLLCVDKLLLHLLPLL